MIKLDYKTIKNCLFGNIDKYNEKVKIKSLVFINIDITEVLNPITINIIYKCILLNLKISKFQISKETVDKRFLSYLSSMYLYDNIL